MKYYINNKTGELMASLENLRDFIDGENVKCITDVIFPYRWLGNGIINHCMTYRDISINYKKITKKKAMEMCSDFGQFRHVDDDLNKSITWLAQVYNEELKPIRKYGFGIPFTDKALANREVFNSLFDTDCKKNNYEKGVTV